MKKKSNTKKTERYTVQKNGKNNEQKKTAKKTSQRIPEQPKLSKEQILQKFGIIAASLLGIIIISWLIYGNSVNYKMVYCDDNIFVNDYFEFNKSEGSIEQSFEQTMGTSYYRPILNLSFIMDSNLGKNKTVNDKNQMDISVFHRTNLILHIVASCLVLIFFIKLGYPIVVGIFFGLLSALHPILTPAATWISGRNDSLITIFILLSFICFIFYKEIKKPWYLIFLVFHLLFFAVSLFTKEIASFFPFICIAYLFLFAKERKIINLKNIIAFCGWGITGLIWLSMRAKAIENVSNPDTIGFDALIKNYPSIFALIGKIFLPVKMIALASYEPFSIITGIVIILAIGVYLIYSKKVDKKKALFGIFWFALLIFPTLIIRIVYVDDFFDYAEHRAYLVMVGVFIAIVEILKSMKVNFKNPATLFIGALILVVFGYRSFAYKNVFEDRKTFWRHMTELYPNKSRGYLDLGKAYFVEDSLDTSEKMYKLGIERNPGNKNLYIDLSAIYLRRKDFKKAEEYSRKALSVDPLGPIDPIANYNLGKSLYSRSEFSKALPYLEQACYRNTKFADWYFDLGICYFNLQRHEDALIAFQKAIQLRPSDYLSFSNMGAVFASQGKYKEAETCWLKSISIYNKFPDPYLNLIRYYTGNNDIEKAKFYYNELKKFHNKIPADIVDLLLKRGIPL